MNRIETSFPVCPECGFVHPPDPSGKCPWVNKINKDSSSSSNNNQQSVPVQSSKPVVIEKELKLEKDGIDFTDMSKSLVDIAATQIKMKKITDVNEINKVKQYVIIEVTKAFERYPHQQV